MMQINHQQTQDWIGKEIDRWHLLHKEQGDTQKTVESLYQSKDRIYSQLSYWDTALNCLPLMFSYLLAYDYGKVSEYHHVVSGLKESRDSLARIDAMLSDTVNSIFKKVIRKEGSDPFIQKKVSALMLLQFMNHFGVTLKKSLTKALDSELKDGRTSNRGYLGKGYDQQSKEDNFKVARLINELNQAVRDYNRQLTGSYFMDSSIAPLNELYGAGKRIIDSELLEDHPDYDTSLGLGDWWASGNTYNVLKEVESKVVLLLNEVDRQSKLVKEHVEKYVADELMESYPDFIEASTNDGTFKKANFY